MKRNYILPAVVSLMALTACEDTYNEDNFDGVKDMSRPTNVVKAAYTVTDADYEKFGGDLKTNKYFSALDNPDDYLPGLLQTMYFSADKTSTVNVSYRLKQTSGIYSDIPYLALRSYDDYAPAYEAGKSATCLDTTTIVNMDKILNEQMKDAATGAFALVQYQYSKNPAQLIATPVFFEDFEGFADAGLDSTWYVKAEGKDWSLTTYNNNKYMQFTANGADGAAEAWMITPEIEIKDAQKKLAWDVTVGYYNADCLKVYIIEGFDGKDLSKAQKTDVTSQFNIPKEPAKGYGTMASAGQMALSDYSGKKIRVGFQYSGNGKEKKTTTYQIDNILVGNEIPTSVQTGLDLRFALYNKEAKGWALYNGENSKRDMFIFQDQYGQFGLGKDMAFSSTVKSTDYLPNYLNKNIDYPVNGDTCTVMYRYNAGSGKYQAKSDTYIYNDTLNVWKYWDETTIETRQYAYDGSKWLFSPSVTIDLPAVKNDAETSAFYQAIVDWVIDEHPEYVSSYKTNDYYFGSSAYQNNFDFRISAWKKQGTYNDMSDADLEKLMWQRLPEAFPHALQTLYASAKPVEGVDVIYTINFVIYSMPGTSNNTNWTIQYKVTGPGQFEYVPESLKQIQ